MLAAGREEAGLSVVGVDGPCRRPRLVSGTAQHVEELRFLLPVILERHVEVQVLRRQVGEDCNVEFAALDPAHCQGVRANLHHRGVASGIDAAGEERLQVRGLRRGEPHLVGLQRAGIVELDGGAVAGPDPRGPEDGCREHGGAGLAISACNPHQLQPARRMAVEGARDVSQGDLGVRNDGRRRLRRYRELAHDGGRSLRDCLGDKVVAVELLPAQRDEQVSGTGPAAVGGNPCYFDR